MAAKPIERFVKKQIQEQGGWDRIVERIASGETVAGVARTLLRPDGVAITRSFLSRLLHKDDERSRRVMDAHKEGAAAMVDEALEIVDRAPADRDSVNKAKVQAETRIKIASFRDRETWGERQPQVNVNLNVGEMHLGALRHREVIAEKAIEAAHTVELVTRAGEKLLALAPNGSSGGASHAPGTSLSPVATVDPERSLT